jgi:hypothetical protein
MRTFSIFVHHANSPTPSLMFEVACDQTALGPIAEKSLAGSLDWVAVEVRENDQLIFSVARDGAAGPPHLA